MWRSFGNWKWTIASMPRTNPAKHFFEADLSKFYICISLREIWQLFTDNNLPTLSEVLEWWICCLSHPGKTFFFNFVNLQREDLQCWCQIMKWDLGIPYIMEAQIVNISKFTYLILCQLLYKVITKKLLLFNKCIKNPSWFEIFYFQASHKF